MSVLELGLFPAPRHAHLVGSGPPLGTSLQEQLDPGLPEEGYHLTLRENEARLVARDDRGLRYGRDSFEQIRARTAVEGESRLPGLHVEDSPDFPERGFMLDVSRDRVPRMDALRALVDTLARLRFNQLQLYTEHTFAYREHREVWAEASPLLPDEIQELDAFCGERGIELVPNQNSFGHMERWLAHAAYAKLAELGEQAASGRPRACLVPDERSADFVCSLYDELLPNFRSRRINIGCDETFELGRGRSRERCETVGTERVYLEFVAKLIRHLRRNGYSAQLWGDVLGRRPDVVRELDSEVTALVWGYEAPMDPDALPEEARERLRAFGVPPEWMRGFEPRVEPFAGAGIPLYVCPGTSSWNSLVGRLSNARANVDDAVEVGRTSGARGLLLTDWGDNGHMQPPVVSLPALVHAGACAWCAASNRDLDLRVGLRAVLDDSRTIDALLELGELFAATGERALNASPLFWSLLRPLAKPLPTLGAPGESELREVEARISGILESLSDEGPAGQLQQAGRLAGLGARRQLRRRFESGPTRSELAAELRELIPLQRERWLETSRPGGLATSVSRLEARLDD